MSTPLTHPERVAAARLHALLELLPTAMDKRLRSAGITAFEYTILESLAEAPQQRMRLSTLAQKTNGSLPRISRVTASLERRGLTGRSPCPEDARATNAVLLPPGQQTYEKAQAIYADAVRELVFEGARTMPGDGVSILADLSYAVLGSLDPHRRGGLTETSEDSNDNDNGAEDASTLDCAADPCLADPALTASG